MKCYWAIAVLLVGLFSVPTKAAGNTQGVGTIGTGTFSCEKFSRYDGAPNSSGQMNLVVQWAWGFISAYNTRAAFSAAYQENEAPNPISPPDANSILLFHPETLREEPSEQCDQRNARSYRHVGRHRFQLHQFRAEISRGGGIAMRDLHGRRHPRTLRKPERRDYPPLGSDAPGIPNTNPRSMPVALDQCTHLLLSSSPPARSP